MVKFIKRNTKSSQANQREIPNSLIMGCNIRDSLIRTGSFLAFLREMLPFRFSEFMYKLEIA